jgi:N-acetylglucosamine kinase-like BadF-type ATPase
MIFIADGGSTKADWIALDNSKNELFRTRTLGLNPAVFPEETLYNRVINNFQLVQNKDLVKEIYFYGAGCGTPKPTQLLVTVFKSIFINAKVVVKEDLYGAVYASSGGKKSIVCILGTGSNSCYFDGEKLMTNVVSLGYILMDEASGNYFGKKLIRDYFYHKMPDIIAKKFENTYNLDPDEIKRNLYQEESPNAYLGKFAQFMFEFKEHAYIRQIIEEAFNTFFEYRIKPYKQATDVPIYFIGSIAYFFESILQEVADKFGYTIKEIIRRPIDNLIAYHQNNL